MKLQKEQQQILDTQNKDIIVSAGAGSGKTFVMIEKILSTILNNRVPVTKLLVVTFTNAAATEMHQKLEKRLRSHLSTLDPKSEEYAFVLEQINLLPQSNICTLHKFCQNIISKYFYVLDMDVGFGILDDVDSKMLKNKALDEVLFEIEKTEEKPIVDLLYIYDRKRDNKKIKSMVLQVYNYLENQPNPQQFENKVLDAYKTELDKNPFALIINDHMTKRFEYYKQSFSEFLKSAQIEGFDKLVPVATYCFETCNLFLNTQNFKSRLDLLFKNTISLPSTPKATPEYAELQQEFKLVKTQFSKELGDFEKWCVCDDAKLLEQDLLKNSEIMDGIFKLYARFKTRFQALKKKRNLVDFGDLEHMCLQILQNKDIEQEVKQSFDAVYVDEYQDINDIQEQIISRVHKEGSLFLVGDVKQSIYGFRNTNPQIFIEKVKIYGADKHKSSVLLNCNFRSDQRVLDFVNLVFSKLMTDESVGVDYQTTSLMGSDQQYVVPNTNICQVEIDVVDTQTLEKAEKETPTQVYSVKDANMEDVFDFDVAQTEGNVVADKILNLMSSQKQIFDSKLGENGGLRDIRFGDISILCQNRNPKLSVILQTLRQRGIPVEDFGGENIFDSYEVQVLYNYLRLLNNSHDDLALTTLLSSPVANLSDDQLLKIRLSNKEAKFFYECLDSIEDKEIKSKLDRLDDLINMGRDCLLNGTVYDCLTNFVNETNFESIVSLLPSGKARISNLWAFVNHFVGRNYNQNLFEFINFVESNDNSLELDASASSNDDIVHVLTMHHSKGLEYPIVFLINLGHNFNTSDQKEEIVFFDNLGVGLYAYDYLTRTKRNTLSRTAIVLKLKERALAENLRLLYVAMTRAKNNLFLVGSANLATFSPSITTFDLQKCTNFMQLVLSGCREAISNLQSSKHISALAMDYRKNEKKHIFDLFVYNATKHESKNAEILTNPLKLSDYVPEFEQKVQKLGKFCYTYQNSTNIGLKNSVTSLNKLNNEELQTNFHESTTKFLIDEQKVETNADLGTIYHKAMELVDFGLDDEAQIFDFLKDKMPLDELKQIDCAKIKACIRSLRPLINDADVILKEQPFMLYVPYNTLVSSKVCDKVLVQGIVDLIVIKGDEAIVVDYKMTNTKDKEILKKRYATQLECYKLAIEKSKKVRVTKKILYSFLQEVQIIV